MRSLLPISFSFQKTLSILPRILFSSPFPQFQPKTNFFSTTTTTTTTSYNHKPSSSSHHDESWPEVLQILFSHWIPYAFSAVLKLNIPEILQKNPESIDNLVLKTGTQKQPLIKLLRSLHSIGYFHQRSDGLWENNTKSLLLIRFKGIINITVQQAGPVLTKLPDYLKTGKSVWPQISGGLHYWEWLAQNPKERALFDDMMSSITFGLIPALVQHFDWEKYNKKNYHITDVGGNLGAFLVEILNKKCPEAKGTIFDLPSVESKARSFIEKSEVKDRINFITGDFFKTIPNTDVIILKQILHDWNDEKVVEILKTCHKALSKSKTEKGLGHLILIESIVPEEHKITVNQSHLDLLMAALLEGEERTRSEWERLLKKAGFEVKRMVSTPTLVTLLEAVAV